MIYNKSTYNRITLFYLLTAGIVLIALFVFGITEYRQSELKMKQEMRLLFEQSINEEVKLKMEGTYVSVNLVNDPTVKNERVRSQTIITEETINSKETEVSGDVYKEFMKSSQSFLLYMNRLQPDTLQQIFHSKLEANGIKAHAVVLVRHSQKTEMSDDTTQYRISYHTPIIKGGAFNEITYEGLLSYRASTLIRLMPKKILWVLFVLENFLLSVVIYLIVKKMEIRSDKIMKRGKHYYIGKTMFDTIKNELITGKKVVNIPKQPAGILLMLLESKDFAVEKVAILEKYWGESETAYNSMTSVINKLRNLLNDADCTFNIPAKKSVDFYTLQYRGSNTTASKISRKAWSSDHHIA